MDKADISLSTTAFGDSNCLKRYYYRWDQHLVLKPSEVKSVMRRGTWIHRSLELIDHREAWLPELMRMAGWAQEHEVPEEQIDKLQFEVIAIVEDYANYWAGHEDENGPYETVGTEVALTWSPAPGKTIKATIDRIVKDRKGRLWVWERKSTSDIPDSTWRAVDPQTLFQYVVCRMQNLPVVGIIFDYVLTEPGPALRVKKDGRFYAGLEDKNTTSRAFSAVEQQVRDNWKETDSKGIPIDAWESPDAYLNAMRVRMVNDGRWFQRYPVFRPEESVRETMRDVAARMTQIQNAQTTGFWPRSFNVFTCSRFCPYGKLCMTEYANGRVSEFTRQELYVVENPDIRAEGRTS